MTSLRIMDSMISVEDYLEGEPCSDVRHEYIEGAVYAMAGGTQNHNIITGNIFAALHLSLRGQPCRPFINDMKVRIKTLSSDCFYYPDVVVTCDKNDTNSLYLESPTTLFEVLSESTARIDRNEKFLAYTSIPSVQEYILVAQDGKQVLIARRENNWEPEQLSGDDFEINLSCTETPLTSEMIYGGVEF